MLAASHALIGASVARLVPDPAVAIPLNLLFHFAADLFPHWDLHTRDSKLSKNKVIFFSLADAAGGYILGYFLFKAYLPLPYLLLMMFLAQLPDWIEAPYRIFGWNGPFLLMKKLQSRLHYKLGFPWGLITQIIVVSGLILVSR